MNVQELLATIATMSHDRSDAGHVVALFLDCLERGDIRTAHYSDGRWHVDVRVKQGILLAFRLGHKERCNLGPLTFIDKNTIMPRQFADDASVRIVPGGTSVRRGAYVGKNVVIMPPSFINIGAFVGDESMIDSHALVGSCAMVGSKVHVSAGAQIGGVLEPVGARPVIIEDGAFIGGNTGIYEGTLVGRDAVIGAGVVLTRSSKVFDLVHERVIEADDDGLSIPEGAVVVPGSRKVKGEFALSLGLSIAAAIIVKYRDDVTSSKAKLESTLRH